MGCGDLLLQDVGFVEEEDDGSAFEPGQFQDGPKQGQTLLHSVLGWEAQAGHGSRWMLGLNRSPTHRWRWGWQPTIQQLEAPQFPPGWDSGQWGRLPVYAQDCFVPVLVGLVYPTPKLMSTWKFRMRPDLEIGSLKM